MIRIFLVYALSGFVSLGYQVAWFRIFTDWFGSTNLTFALVVSNFIGGLAVGAASSKYVTDFFSRQLKLTDKLRLYGLIETFVAGGVLLTVLAKYIPADLWGSFPYFLSDGIWVQAAGYRFFQTLIAAICVFLPCVFMGVTFPLLCDTFRNTSAGHEFPAAIYAWNTLGACIGVLTCQFFLLPWLGHNTALWVMIGLNLLLGAYFLIAGSADLLAASATESAVRVVQQRGPNKRDAPAQIGVLLMFAAISGFVSGALEGDMFKRISFVMELNPGATMSFISFWAILAIFLASAVVRRWRRLSLVHIKIAFAAGLVYFLITSSFIDEIMFAVDAGFDVLAGPYAQQRIALLVFPNNLLELLIFTGILVFLPYFCVSLMLPHVCNRIQSLDRHIGFAYGLNTVAFCIGLVAFTLVAPRVNIFYSLKLFTLLFGIAIFSVFLLRERQRIRIWQPGIFLLACVVAALITSTSFDKHFFPATTDPATHPVSALKSNGANTTFVVNVDGDRALYFGRLKMSATSLRARTYMRLMAHFPLLLHAQPETALLICFGAGNTAAALAAHESLRQIDVVDLNDKVFKTAPEFAATNDEVYLDPRVRFIHDDGRNYLNFTDQTYDLITSEPPPPLAAGVYRLYSREYYMAAKQRMTPEGLMTQWLPMHLMDPGSVELAIRTFTAVFPDTLIITGFGSDFILVGGKSSLGLTRLERRFHESARVKADLERLRIRRPADLLARVVVGDRKLRDRYSGMRVISDQHNDLEGLFRDRSRPVIIWYDPKTVLAYLTARVPQLHNELESTLMHLGRLRYRVHGFPFASLATVGFSDVAGVALGKTDWIEIAKLNDSLRFAAGAGRIEEMIGVLEKLLRVAEEQPEVLLALADLRIRAAEYPAAIIALREFQRLEPDDPVGYRLFGRALMLNGQADEAVTQFQEAQRLDPDDYVPLLRLAWILATHPDRARRQPDEALRLAKTAADLTAYRNVEVLNTLAAAYASAGQFERAVEVGQSAIEAFDANAGVGLDNLNLHLRAYRNRQSLSDQSLAPES